MHSSYIYKFISRKENAVRVMCGYEICFSVHKVTSIIWTGNGLPLCYQGTIERGGVSALVLTSRAVTLFHVHGNIGMSHYKLVKEHLESFIDEYDSQSGENGGLLIIIDRA